MRRRRLKRCLAVSTVIGNMLMILITLSLAAILVAWAGTSFGAFSGGSQLFFVQRGQALQERFVIEAVFFNNTSPAHSIMIFVRNAGQIDVGIAQIYVNGANLAFNPEPSDCPTCFCLGHTTCSLGTTNAIPNLDLPVQQVVEFNLNWGSTWTSGTVFTILVASYRGNQAVATARGP